MRRCLENFQCRGKLLIWIMVGQGPIALGTGANGACIDIFFSCLSFLFPFSHSWNQKHYLKGLLVGWFVVLGLTAL